LCVRGRGGTVQRVRNPTTKGAPNNSYCTASVCECACECVCAGIRMGATHRGGWATNSASASSSHDWVMATSIFTSLSLGLVRVSCRAPGRCWAYADSTSACMLTSSMRYRAQYLHRGACHIHEERIRARGKTRGGRRAQTEVKNCKRVRAPAYSRRSLLGALLVSLMQEDRIRERPVTARVMAGL
jgi:hypothetical protein